MVRQAILGVPGPPLGERGGQHLDQYEVDGDPLPREALPGE